MKILSFDVLYFKLPDNFEGGLSAALRAFADYHDSVTDTPKQVIGKRTKSPSDLTAEQHTEKRWDEFWTMIHSEDRRVHGVAGMAEYTSDMAGIARSEYDLDLNTGARE